MKPDLHGAIPFADHILQAPPEWIALEPPECLLELIEVGIEALQELLPHAGLGWKIIQLEILKDKTQKKLDRCQPPPY